MRHRAFLVAALVAACGIAACSTGGNVTPNPGGGGGGTVPQSSTVVLTPSSQTVGFPQSSGYAGTIAIPAGSGTADVAVTSSAPSGAPVIQTGKKTPASGTVPNSALFYIKITAVSAITLNSIPGFTVTLLSTPDGALFEAGAQQNGTLVAWSTIAGPFEPVANVVTVPMVAQAVTIPAGQSVYLALYTGGEIDTPPINTQAGTSSTFAGTLTTNTVYTYPTSLPSAVPSTVFPSMPPTNASATVTSTVTVRATDEPGLTKSPAQALTNVVDFNTVETDAYALRSNVYTTDALMGLNVAQYEIFGSTVGDGAGDTVNTQYSSPYTLLDFDSNSWTNNPAATITETDADATNSSRTVNGDGTYTETQTIPGARTLIITVNADGSGTYSGTAFNTFRGNNGWKFSTPSPTNVITIQTVPTPKPTGTPAPPTTVATPAAWYPVPFVPYVETDAFTNNAAVDSSCHLPAQFGVQAGNVVQTIHRVDPVLGYLETQTTTTYYQNGIGAVCVVMNDVQEYHYNFNNDDGTIASAVNVFGTGGIKSTTTTHEVVSMQTLHTASSSLAQKTSAATTQALSSMTIAYSRAQFDGRLALERRAHANAMVKYLDKLSQTLGGSL